MRARGGPLCCGAMNDCKCAKRKLQRAFCNKVMAHWKHIFHAKPFVTNKGAVLRATRWKHRVRLLLPAAQRSAETPMLRSPRTGAWGAMLRATLSGSIALGY